MQKQFLGDAKDSFKWDYLDFLACKLGYSRLTIALMMRPDGKNGPPGLTNPEDFAARECVISLCHKLRATRDPNLICSLPNVTGASYQVFLHRGCALFTREGRSEYFADFDTEHDQLVFLDPDNGFEPKKCTEQHVCYEDVAHVLRQVTPESAVAVFQHFRYEAFPDDFVKIRARLGSCHSTAIYSDHVNVMIVGIAQSRRTIEFVRDANQAYMSSRATHLKVIP